MGVSAGNRGDPAEPADKDRNRAVRGGSVAKLSTRIAAPGPDRSIALERQRVIGAGGDSHDASEIDDLDRRRHGGVGGRRGATGTELAEGVVPPGPDRAVCLER